MEKQTLEQELEKLHAASFGWALGCCGWNRAEAEDVLQATYLKILEGRARFNGESTLKTWLFALIRRTAAENRKRNFLRNLRLSNFFFRQPSLEPLSGKASAMDESDLRSRLISLLSSLPIRQREVLELVFYHDLTIEEAARVMGISLGTARTHYERGKKQLRKKLDPGETP